MISRDQRDESAPDDADQAFLFRYLAASDATCPQCGYNLRALTSPRCPECGEALRIGVGLTHPHLREWLWLAVPLIASAGIGLFLILLFVGRGSLPPRFLYPYFRVALTYFCAAIPLAALVVVKRRAILRMRASRRACLTAFAWAAATIATVMALLRR